MRHVAMCSPLALVLVGLTACSGNNAEGGASANAGADAGTDVGPDASSDSAFSQLLAAPGGTPTSPSDLKGVWLAEQVGTGDSPRSARARFTDGEIIVAGMCAGSVFGARTGYSYRKATDGSESLQIVKDAVAVAQGDGYKCALSVAAGSRDISIRSGKMDAITSPILFVDGVAVGLTKIGD